MSHDLCSFPTVPEQIVTPFIFYLNGHLCQGIQYAEELYALAHEFNPEQRLLAYEQATNLVQQGQGLVLTVSACKYRSWISLRSRGCRRHFFPTTHAGTD